MKKKFQNIWIFAEEVEPGKMRWGIRAGNDWYDVKSVLCMAPVISKFQKIAPHMYLFCKGYLMIKNDTAYINISC